MAFTTTAHNDVEVRISRRTLWVDSQAYPLAHVTRVRPLEIKPRYSGITRAYLREAGACVALGLVGLVAIGCTGAALPQWVATVFALLVFAVLMSRTVQLIRRLTRPTMYVLS